MTCSRAGCRCRLGAAAGNQPDTLRLAARTLNAPRAWPHHTPFPLERFIESPPATLTSARNVVYLSNHVKDQKDSFETLIANAASSCRYCCRIAARLDQPCPAGGHRRARLQPPDGGGGWGDRGVPEGALSLHAGPRQRARRDSRRVLRPLVPHGDRGGRHRRVICTSTTGRRIASAAGREHLVVGDRDRPSAAARQPRTGGARAAVRVLRRSHDRARRQAGSRARSG